MAFFPRVPALRIKNPSMVASDHEAKNQGRKPVNETAAALGAVVLMLRVVETGDPLGVTLAGENAQLDAAGRPLQANVTGEFMPLTGLIVMVNVAAWPALIVALAGEASMVKSPLALPTTRVVVPVLGPRTASPGYSALRVYEP